MYAYNIDFALAGMLISLILHIYSKKILGNTETSGNFRLIVFMTFLGCFLDVFTTITTGHPEFFSPIVNIIFCSILLLTVACIALLFILYVMAHIEKTTTHVFEHRKHLFILYIIDIISFVINLWTRHLIDVKPDGTYLHGPLYITNVIITVFYGVYMLYLFFRYKSDLKPLHARSIIILILLVMGGAVIQYVLLPNVLVLTFCCSLACIPVYFTMETPDYRALIQANNDLEKARAEAETASNAKTDFLANMSHEIRTPINAVLGMNEMIIRENSDPSIAIYAEKIKSAGQNLLSLINDILDITKVEAGKMEMVKTEFYLKDLIEDLYNMVETSMANKALNFIITVDENLPNSLKGDVAHIRQILVNLLNNANKYTARGTVTLIVTGTTNGDTVTLSFSIKDTGSGIKKEDLESIFAKFSRAELDKNINISGTGLGLNLSTNLAHMLNGEITVKSIYKVGSIFTLTLPVQVIGSEPIGKIELNLSSTSSDTPKAKTHLVTQDTHILAVDDVENNLQVIQLLLKRTAADVDVALSGAQCIDMCMNKKYDIILLDHMMPQMDGIDTFKSMKSIPDFLNANTPVVMLTANAITGMKEKYMAEGFSDYLTKPVRGELLEATIRKFLPPSKIKE